MTEENAKHVFESHAAIKRSNVRKFLRAVDTFYEDHTEIPSELLELPEAHDFVMGSIYAVRGLGSVSVTRRRVCMHFCF